MSTLGSAWQNPWQPVIRMPDLPRKSVAQNFALRDADQVVGATRLPARPGRDDDDRDPRVPVSDESFLERREILTRSKSLHVCLSLPSRTTRGNRLNQNHPGPWPIHPGLVPHIQSCRTARLTALTSAIRASARSDREHGPCSPFANKSEQFHLRAQSSAPSPLRTPGNSRTSSQVRMTMRAEEVHHRVLRDLLLRLQVVTPIKTGQAEREVVTCEGHRNTDRGVGIHRMLRVHQAVIAPRTTDLDREDPLVGRHLHVVQTFGAFSRIS